MKLLKTTNTDIAKYCQDYFGFKLPSGLITEQIIAKLKVSHSV